MNTRGGNLPKVLFVIFLVTWLVLAIKPLYRFVWLYENIVIFLAVPAVIWSYFKFRLSNASYILIFIFAMLHIAAAHYSYGATPWGNWLRDYFEMERNHYDRLIHFLFGLMMAPVASDALRNYLPRPLFLQGIFVFSMVFSLGALYEVGEYVAGILLRPDIGLRFLGFQGDIWDTQKDMILQASGAVIGFGLWRLFRTTKKTR